MKKLVVLLMAIAMMFAIIGCGSKEPQQAVEEEKTVEATEENISEPADEGVALSDDGRYPAETVKLGFVNYDTTAEQVLKLQEYFDYLDDYLNFEIIWSESLSSAEEEFEFMERCAAAGCKGIIGYYNEGKEESQKLAESLGMYYWGTAGGVDNYDMVKTNEYYVGTITAESNANYEMGYSIAEMLVENDCHKIIVMSGGKDYGVQMFIDRYNGVMAGIADAKDGGYDIEVVYEVPGWPGTEEFAAHQTAALDTDADGFAGTLSSLMWIQPMQTAGKFGQIKVACIDTISQVTVDMMHAGMYVGVCSEPVSSFGGSVPMIINAVEGYKENLLDENGAAPMVVAKNLEVTTPEEAQFYVELETEGGSWIWDIEDIQSILGAYNPDFTAQDVKDLYYAVSVDEINARKAD